MQASLHLLLFPVSEFGANFIDDSAVFVLHFVLPMVVALLGGLFADGMCRLELVRSALYFNVRAI